jgi:hypothetical protein
MYKKHDFWDNLRGKIRIILSITSILFKPETQNLNVRSTNKTVFRTSSFDKIAVLVTFLQYILEQ